MGRGHHSSVPALQKEACETCIERNTMNERIQLLAEQATTYIEPTANSGEGWIFNKEKFAELIVRECAELAKHNVMNISTYADAEFVDRQIKQHFGVAE